MAEQEARSCVGASAAEVGPKLGPMWATWPCTASHQSQKTLEIAVTLQVFQRVALNPQDWGRWASLGSGCPKSGLTWPNLILAPTGAQVGASAEVESKSIRMNVRSKSKSRPKVPKRGSLAGLAARDMNGQIPQSDWYSLQLGGGMFARARSPNCTGLR